MEENNVVKDVAVETTKALAKDVYNDALQPTAQNVGGALGTFSGFFNHVVLYPLKKLNIEYEKKAMAFERTMESKYNLLPEDNRVEPQLNIVGPAMESLKYNIMEDDLADMYSNLLISNMDSKTQGLCSPMFIKIIEQLSPKDAIVFRSIYLQCKLTQAIPVCEIKIVEQENEKKYVLIDEFPRYVTDTKQFGINENDISKSLQVLSQLGLIELNFMRSFTDKTIYEQLSNQSFIIDACATADRISKTPHKVLIDDEGVIIINDLGFDFAKVCMRKV